MQVNSVCLVHGSRLVDAGQIGGWSGNVSLDHCLIDLA
jgi:hypothetical protein